MAEPEKAIAEKKVQDFRKLLDATCQPRRGVVTRLLNTLQGVVALSQSLRTFLRQRFSGDDQDRLSAEATAVPAHYLQDEEEDPVVTAQRQSVREAYVKQLAKKQAEQALKH